MNAIDLLKEDHEIVDALFKQVEATTPSRYPPLFKRIKGELDTHAHVEETIFYPALLKKGDAELADIVREGIEEHKQIKMFLADLERKTPKNAQFEAKLKVLIEDTRHHVKEEENEMFPLVEDQFAETALEGLGTELEKEKKKFQSANKIKPENREKALGPLGKLVRIFTDGSNDRDEIQKSRPKTSKPKSSVGNGGKSNTKAGKATRKQKTTVATPRSSKRATAPKSAISSSGGGKRKAATKAKSSTRAAAASKNTSRASKSKTAGGASR